jgi:hypothetical protein
MNVIVNNNGEYLETTFVTENGTWDLHGTQCNLNDKAGESIDTFRNRQTGRFKDISRREVYKKAEQGLFKSVNAKAVITEPVQEQILFS